MRKILALCCLLSLLTGCRSRDMERFFVVTAMAVDYAEGQYAITLEGGGDQTGEDGSPKALLYKGIGANPTQCFLDIQKQTGEYPYLRQTALVVLSDAVTADALTDLMGYLLNENGVRLNARVALCRGEAGAMLSDEGFESQRILKALTQGGGTLTSADIQLRDLAMTWLEEGIDGSLPLTSKEKTEGIALLSGHALTGELPPRLTPIFMLAGGAKTGDGLTVTVDGAQMAFRLLDSKGECQMDMDGNIPVCTIKINAEFRGASLLEEDAPKYERALKLRLEQDAKELLKTLQAADCDALGFGQMLRRKDPKGWQQIGENWPQYFARCRVQTDISVKLVSRGRLMKGEK